MYRYMHICISTLSMYRMCIHIYIYICIYVHMHAYTHTYTYVCILRPMRRLAFRPALCCNMIYLYN